MNTILIIIGALIGIALAFSVVGKVFEWIGRVAGGINNSWFLKTLLIIAVATAIGYYVDPVTTKTILIYAFGVVVAISVDIYRFLAGFF